MRKLLLLLLLVVLTPSISADGTVTTPGNISPTSWKLASISMITGSGGDLPSVTITIHYFVNGATVPAQTVSIALTSAEISSFATTMNSPVAGESGTAVKRYRQRVTSWLITNGKISNVTPE